MLFDAYVMVDWSAASAPKRGADSVWIAIGTWESSELRLQPSLNPGTRSAAAATLEECLKKFVARGQRVLLGFDFPYGYPRGFASGLRSVSSYASGEAGWAALWRAVSAQVSDGPDNANNRFEAAGGINTSLGAGAGPFWGHPATRDIPGLKATSPSFPLAVAGVSVSRYRVTEARLRERGSQVQEVWKLYGAGSVGSQALVGIPRLASLRWAEEFAADSAVWPFETGFGPAPGSDQRPFVLHVEIWPGLAPLATVPGAVKDQLQVEGLVAFLAEKDAADDLPALFDSPPGMDAATLGACVREEGWILGA